MDDFIYYISRNQVKSGSTLGMQGENQWILHCRIYPLYLPVALNKGQKSPVNWRED